MRNGRKAAAGMSGVVILCFVLWAFSIYRLSAYSGWIIETVHTKNTIGMLAIYTLPNHFVAVW